MSVEPVNKPPAEPNAESAGGGVGTGTNARGNSSTTGSTTDTSPVGTGAVAGGLRPADVNGDESDYRRVTPWALAAFLTGLLSVLAFIGPLLWLVPVAAVAFGVLALRAIQSQPESFTGRKLAITGMALATILLSSILAHNYAHNRMITGYGRVYGERWMRMLAAKRFDEAYQLRQSHQNRPSEGTNLTDLYMSGPIKEFFEAFTREDLPKRLSELGDDADYTFLSSPYVTRENLTMDVIGLRYRVDSKSGSKKPFVAELELAREYFSGTGEGRWHVRRAVLVPDAL